MAKITYDTGLVGNSGAIGATVSGVIFGGTTAPDSHF
jgi:hypothetical protein